MRYSIFDEISTLEIHRVGTGAAVVVEKMLQMGHFLKICVQLGKCYKRSMERPY